jgi:hypothetical protein
MKVRRFTFISLIVSSFIVSYCLAQTNSTSLPKNTIIVLPSSIAFETLELNDGDIVSFPPGTTTAHITCETLILHGNSKIDLRSTEQSPAAPPAQPNQPQATAPTTAKGSPHDGARGWDGKQGLPGANGINLNFSIQKLVAADGSLWIQTDGGRGGPGGNAGNGGKGSSGPHTCAFNPNGGNGGAGGNGGVGGNGGNTATVNLKIGPNTIPASLSENSTYPSIRPTNLVDGSIVACGLPGPGGPGGQYGSGGPGGEGNENHFPCTASDSHAGNPGPNGNIGPTGHTGEFIQ